MKINTTQSVHHWFCTEKNQNAKISAQRTAKVVKSHIAHRRRRIDCHDYTYTHKNTLIDTKRLFALLQMVIFVGRSLAGVWTYLWHTILTTCEYYIIDVHCTAYVFRERFYYYYYCYYHFGQWAYILHTIYICVYICELIYCGKSRGAHCTIHTLNNIYI